MVGMNKDGVIGLQDFTSFFLNRYRTAQKRYSTSMSVRKLLSSDEKKGIDNMDLVDRILFDVRTIDLNDSKEIDKKKR